MKIKDLQTGMWLKIKSEKDNGGAPLIRVERTEPLIVSDWFDFRRRWNPHNRSFRYSKYEINRALKCWRIVTPDARHNRPSESEVRVNGVVRTDGRGEDDV